MGYNQGLAVGLAIGIPCCLVLAGVYALWLRNRKLQQKEDAENSDIDVELRDNNLFKEFGEALHRPYENGKSPSKSKEFNVSEDSHTAVEKHTPSSDLASLSRELTSSKTFSDRRRPVTTPTPSVFNQSHQKTPSSYAFYDTFIPVLPGQSEGDLQPPSFTDKQSVHSSNGSLIGVNGSNLSRSLDNLVKLLQGPQFFEKLPSRAATVTKQRPMFHVQPANNSSSDVVHNVLVDTLAINDDYIYEAGSPRQKHPYRERVGASDKSGVANLERNFDNDITADTEFDSNQPDVIFK